MYKMFILLALTAAMSATSIGSQDENIQIVRSLSDNDGIGSYKFDFEQSDGTKRDEEGNVINLGTDDETIIVKGSYSWIGPDGIQYTVNYVADDKGFQPTIEQGPGGGVPPGVVASLLG